MNRFHCGIASRRREQIAGSFGYFRDERRFGKIVSEI
jgi:hypothetical protein